MIGAGVWAETIVYLEFQNLYKTVTTPEYQSRQTSKVYRLMCYFVHYEVLLIFKRALGSRGQCPGV